MWPCTARWASDLSLDRYAQRRFLPSSGRKKHTATFGWKFQTAVLY
jgi:hypothetical protein